MAGAAKNEPARYRKLFALAMSNARQYEVNHNIHSIPSFFDPVSQRRKDIPNTFAAAVLL